MGGVELEDLRRKKAAALSGNGAQGELEAMTIRLQNMEEKLQQAESERDLLLMQKEETAVKVGSLQDDLDRARGLVSQDEKTVAMLRKSLDTITMERDAAFISREDMVAQLRLMKRRLQEAEEEQYKAEEDAAALRAEIKLLQTSEDQSESLGAISEQLRLAEQHNNALQKELQIRYVQMYIYISVTACVGFYSFIYLYILLNGFHDCQFSFTLPQYQFMVWTLTAVCFRTMVLCSLVMGLVVVAYLRA